jgi:predicted transcriptional regulator
MRTPVLSEIQSKILLALLLRSKVPSAEVLKAVGISGSTWNKEKMLLQNTGLIEGQITRGLAESGIVRKMEFKLTEKGRRVAQNLLAISSMMGDESFETERLENVLELIVKA